MTAWIKQFTKHYKHRNMQNKSKRTETVNYT